MTKKHHKRRHLKGGFLGLNSLGQTFSNVGNSISQGATSFWDKTKKMTGISNTSTPSASTYTPSASTYTPSASTYTPSRSTPYSYGGRRLRNQKIKVKNYEKRR